MENRDVAALLELTLNFKAARGGNIFQIDAAKAAREKGNGVDDLINILAPNAQRNGVHIAERFKEDAFALHHRHAGLRADIAQAQHRRAVCDDGYRIPAACEIIGFIYILLDLQAGLRNTRRVSEGELLLRFHARAGRNFQLALPFIVKPQ